MALTVEHIKRQFEIVVDGETVKLGDPNPRMTVDEVRKHYMGAYPAIATSTTSGPKIEKDGSPTYTFKSSPGTFG